MGDIQELVEQTDDVTVLDEDDIFDIIQELEPLKFRWRSIGLGLRLKSSQLSAIEASHKHDMPGCVEEMVNCWLRKEFDTNKYGPPNWSQLVFAVGVPAGGSNPGVAQKLARKHRKVVRPSVNGVSTDGPMDPPRRAERTEGKLAILKERPKVNHLNPLKYYDENGEKQRLRVLNIIAAKGWRDVGHKLGVREEDLDIIEASVLKEPKRCAEGTISKWLMSGDRPTWEKLLEAIDDADLADLGRQIRKALPTMIP